MSFAGISYNRTKVKPEPAPKTLRLLERHGLEFRCRHAEATGPGELLNQDTFFWGTLKGVGKVYVQVVVDIFCSLAFAKVYTSKMPMTACDVLYDRVLPFYEALGDQRDPHRQRP